MATVSFNSDKPGRGAFRPAFANGSFRFASGTFAFDSSYPTGGESISDITDMFKTCQGVLFVSSGGYVFIADLTNKKVLAYYGDYVAVANGALIQVPNTTDLSALTAVAWLAWGI